MKYLIQYFAPISPGNDIGNWRNINCKGDNLDEAKKLANRILSENRRGITNIRVLEVVYEASSHIVSP